MNRTLVLRKSIGVLAGLLPFGIILLSFLIEWRVRFPLADTLGYTLFILGGLVSVLNFYLSFLRYPIHAFFKGDMEEYQHASGLPLVGGLSYLSLFFIEQSMLISISALVLLLIDTGGVPWFILSVWKDNSFWNTSEKIQSS